MPYEQVKKLLMKGVVKRWDLDENALGAFTMFHPFQVKYFIYIGGHPYMTSDVRGERLERVRDI